MVGDKRTPLLQTPAPQWMGHSSKYYVWIFLDMLGSIYVDKQGKLKRFEHDLHIPLQLFGSKLQCIWLCLYSSDHNVFGTFEQWGCILQTLPIARNHIKNDLEVCAVLLRSLAESRRRPPQKPSAAAASTFMPRLGCV